MGQQSWEQTTDKKAHEPQPQHVDTELSENPTTFTGHGVLPAVAQDDAGTQSASERAGYDDERGKRSSELTAKHGVRPRDYTGALDGNCTSELLVREVMPQITAFLNSKAAAQHLETRFTVAELTTNFLAEGGVLAIQADAIDDLDGFQVAGIDTFMDRYEELKPWLHPSITKDKVEGTTTQNEKHQTVHSIGHLTLVQAAWANATMYAASKTRFERWCKRHGKHIDRLSDVEQFYWTTNYYNAGEGNAEKNLAASGVEAANKKWPKADDWAKYYTNATYNAKMRTSTFEMTRDEVTPGGAFRPVAADKQGAAGEAATRDIDRMRAELERLHEDMTTMDPSTKESSQRRYDQVQQQLEVLENARKHQLDAPAPTQAAAGPEQKTTGDGDDANGGGGW